MDEIPMTEVVQVFQVEDFGKVMRVGTMKTGGRHASIYVEATYSQGKLAITGVVGPLPSGNALGGCGQIDMEFAHRDPKDNDHRYDNPVTPEEIRFAQGWTAEKWFRLLDIWKQWHLNDMHPNCEHQIDWGHKPLLLVNFELNSETREKCSDIESQIALQMRATGKAEIAKEEQYLLNLPFSLTVPGEDQYRNQRPDAKFYVEKSSETKSSGWVRETEHPEGVLCKPCTACGYKYGTEWIKGNIPDGVLLELKSFPDADKPPAWI